MKHPVDIAAVTGTGPGGRITKGDVLLHLEAMSAMPAGPAAGAPLQAAMACAPS